MKTWKSWLGAAVCTGLLGSSCQAQPPTPRAAPVAKKPNLMMILVDDMGYSDLGCYGGEIDTPNIDALAASGVKFSHYRTSAMCVTTRASLLTGMEYNTAGKQPMSFGVPLAHALRAGGYETTISGKWHLAGDPTAARTGFDHFFGFLGGQTDCFQGGDDWRKDGQPFKNFGPDFYSTDALTDYAIERVDQSLDAKQPFFLYLSYNAPHVPLQAPEANVRKYLDRGVYDKGWVNTRQQRVERLKLLGLADEKWNFPPPTADVRPWDLLSKAEQKFEALRQAAYAGMIDRLDQNVGRLVADLKKRDALDNTLIVFASDNGADYAGVDPLPDVLPWERNAKGPRSRLTGSNGWAYANNSPFRYYKHSGHEGGMASPLIVHWPQGVQLPAGTLLHQNVRLWDIYPTFLQAAGLEYDQNFEPDTRPLMGAPLQPLFADATAAGHDDFVSSYIFTRGITHGNWKATSFETSPWELYDLEADRTETNDLAAQKPAVVAAMVARWEAFVKNAGTVDPSWNPPIGEKVYWMDQRKPEALAALTPKISQPDVPLDVQITIQLAGEIVFRDEKNVGMNGRIRLMKYGQEKEVWSIDPTPGHLFDARTLRFNNTPQLEPDTAYYLEWDANVVRYQTDKGVRTMPPQNGETRPWRFKTVAAK